jgi:hypothetical protein
MMLVSRRWFIVVIVFGVASGLCLGVAGYLLVGQASGATAESAKLSAENLLFLCLVLCAALAGLGTVLLLRSLSVSRELDRIVVLARSRADQVERRLARLGPLGDRISALNAALHDVSALRLVRLSALNVTGRIVAASPAFVAKLKREVTPATGIEEMLSGLDFASVVAQLEQTRTPLPWNEGAESCGFHPVFDRRNELANVVCVLGKLEVESGQDGIRARRSAALGRMGRVLQRYLSRARDTRRPA